MLFYLEAYPIWGPGVLYAKQLVKIHFLSQKVCSLNGERMAEENKPVAFIHAVWSSPKPAQTSTWDHGVIQALPELCDTSKDRYIHGNQEERQLKD